MHEEMNEKKCTIIRESLGVIGFTSNGKVRNRLQIYNNKSKTY